MICHPTPRPVQGTQAKPALQLTRPAGVRGRGPQCPGLRRLAQGPTQPVKTKGLGEGTEAGIQGHAGWGRPRIRGALSGAWPSGAGEMAAGHPTLGEQDRVAVWCPMELRIEVTPDSLLGVGRLGGRGGGSGESSFRPSGNPSSGTHSLGALARSLKPLCGLSLPVGMGSGAAPVCQSHEESSTVPSTRKCSTGAAR